MIVKAIITDNAPNIIITPVQSISGSWYLGTLGLS